MDFQIHAAGSLGNRPDLGKRAYRLRFSVVTWPHPSKEQLRHGLRKSLEQTETMLRAQGFRLQSEATVRFERRQARIEAAPIHVVRAPSAREMLPGVMAGAKYRAAGGTVAAAMPLLEESEAWEYIFSALWVHDTILTDRPDPHEEREVMRHR